MMSARFPFSLGNVADLLHERSIDISRDRVQWQRIKCGPMLAAEFRRKRLIGYSPGHTGSDTWNAVLVKFNGESLRLWQPLDHAGYV